MLACDICQPVQVQALFACSTIALERLSAEVDAERARVRACAACTGRTSAIRPCAVSSPRSWSAGGSLGAGLPAAARQLMRSQPRLLQAQRLDADVVSLGDELRRTREELATALRVSPADSHALARTHSRTHAHTHTHTHIHIHIHIHTRTSTCAPAMHLYERARASNIHHPCISHLKRRAHEWSACTYKRAGAWEQCHPVCSR